MLKKKKYDLDLQQKSENEISKPGVCEGWLPGFPGQDMIGILTKAVSHCHAVSNAHTIVAGASLTLHGPHVHVGLCVIL